jgi:hypothetical protein
MAEKLSFLLTDAAATAPASLILRKGDEIGPIDEPRFAGVLRKVLMGERARGGGTIVLRRSDRTLVGSGTVPRAGEKRKKRKKQAVRKSCYRGRNASAGKKIKKKKS